MEPRRRMVYTGDYYCVDYFSGYLPLLSKVYISMADIPEYFHFYWSFIDCDEKDYSYLAEVDPRFKYKIVECVKDADYVICRNSLKQDYKECELIATMDEYCLFKIKRLM